MVYFTEAIESMFPGSVQATCKSLEATDLPSLEILFTSLVNELYEIDGQFIIVLDDFHNIRDKRVHELIQKLLIHPPKAMHLAVVTRRDPPFSMSALRASGRMTEIRMQDLRFSPSEVNSFLRRVMDVDVDNPVAALIGEKTEGWVAGLRLAVLSLRQRSDLQRIADDLPDNNHYVMDYLIAEVIAHQPTEVQDYLLATAILDRFCAPLCESLCFDQDEPSSCPVSGRQFIDKLVTENMFLISLDDNHKWYRYHHLFKQLLQREMRRSFPQEKIKALKNRAGQWFAKNHLLDEAFRYLLAADNIPAVRHMVVTNRYVLTRHEKWHRLNRWIKAIPEDYLINDPELLIITAWIQENQESYQDLRDTIKQIDRILTKKPAGEVPDKSILGELDALKSALFYLQGDIGQAKSHASLATERIPENHLSERAFAVLIYAFVHQMDGAVHLSRKIVNDAFSGHETTGTTYTSRLLLTLCFVDWLEGDLAGVQRHAARLLDMGQANGLLESIAFGHYHLGVTAYYLADSETAHFHLTEAVRNGKIVDPNTYVHANCALALTHFTDNQPDKADEIGQALSAYAVKAQNTALLGIANALNAELDIRMGRLEAADNWSRNLAAEPPKQAVRFFVPQFTQIKNLVLQGSSSAHRKAYDLLNQLHDFFSSVHNTHCLIDVLVLKTMLHDASGDQPAGLTDLERALDLAHPSQRIRPFLDFGPPMMALLKQLRQNGRFTSYIDRIGAAHGRLSRLSTDHLPPNQASHRSLPSGEMREPLDQPLTNRELDIVHLMAERLSNKEIAAKLFIAPGTVKRHTNNIYRKLATHDRQKAVAEARAMGLI
jgi:LuxR family maltose regulon positive regulatory protein